MVTIQDPNTPITRRKAVDRLFSEWDNWDTPGAAVVVVQDGAVVYERGYGCANLEYDVPITPATEFHVASVSKQFTAFAIALLADEGRLALDEARSKYVPEVPDFGKTITICHLIHHTSGLRCIWELMELAGWRRDDVFTRGQLLKLVTHLKELNFAPGEEYLYTNLGYFLLAEVVERVTGQPLRRYAEANIFKPLGMSRTHVHDDHEMIVKNSAHSYTPDPAGGFRKCVLSTAYGGPSSLYTTVQDLARWILNFEDRQVGGSAVFSQMLQPGVLNDGARIGYAFGLELKEEQGLKMIYHSGGTAGYRSHLVWFPDRRLGVAVLSNLRTFVAERLALQVADLYLGSQLVPAVREVALDPALYGACAGNYLLPNGQLASVTEKDGRLVSQMLGYPELELALVSENRFVVTSVHGVVGSFQRDDRGRVVQLTVHQEGMDVPAQRIEPLPLTPDQLADYQGDYYSDELEATYSVVVQGDRLVMQHRRLEDTPLTPTGKDRFAGFERGWGAVSFLRGGGGQVTGLHVSGERTRKLHFERQTSTTRRIQQVVEPGTPSNLPREKARESHDTA